MLEILGYLGWDDFWWNSRTDDNIGHHNKSMQLGERGKHKLEKQHLSLIFFCVTSPFTLLKFSFLFMNLQANKATVHVRKWSISNPDNDRL